MTAINHKEPDRVPLFLLLSSYGAKERQISIKEYFSDPKLVARTQLAMAKKYHNDCLYTFFYAPLEVEARGGEVLFFDNCPPNAGEPLLKSFADINHLKNPQISACAPLKKVLETTSLLKEQVKNTMPIISVVISPFSIPVMQMGFDKYIELLYGHRQEFAQLMHLNEEFCVSFANAQLKAGASAICYFDPLASPAMIERKTYLKTGWPVAKRTISRIKGPVATHLGSSMALPVIEDIIKTGSPVIGFSADDDLEEIKKASQGKVCLLGNLNALEMTHWDDNTTKAKIKNIIAKAARGGGLILSDNHGEIPLQVPEETLLCVAETVQKYGTYPLKWADNNE